MDCVITLTPGILKTPLLSAHAFQVPALQIAIILHDPLLCVVVEHHDRLPLSHISPVKPRFANHRLRSELVAALALSPVVHLLPKESG